MAAPPRPQRSAGLFPALILIGACSAPPPGDSQAPSQTAAPITASAETTSAPPSVEPSRGATPAFNESDDPAAVLTGRAVEAIDGGVDAVLRIGAAGYRVPDDERIYDIHGDRVLTTRAAEGVNATMIVRDLDGRVLREFDSGMSVPQTGIIRGEDVLFGGIDLAEDPLDSIDRGAWVAAGDAPPTLLLPPSDGLAIYQAFEVSPDGRTVGITRSEREGATTYFVRDDSVIELPANLLLITMTNEVAVLIGAFSDITAFAIADGTELWRAETDGVYGPRYATSDGARIVNSVVEDDGDGDGQTSDQLRIELLDARTGVAGQTVRIPVEASPSPWVTPTLSSDRYVALLDTVLPNLADGPGPVQVVDLAAGTLLEVELQFGEVP